MVVTTMIITMIVIGIATICIGAEGGKGRDPLEIGLDPDQ